MPADQLTVYIVDNSEAAFQSEDYPTNRWSFQLDCISALCCGLTEQEESHTFSVVTACGKPALSIPKTSNADALWDLRGKSPSSGGADFYRALKLAMLSARSQSAKIVTLVASEGPLPDQDISSLASSLVKANIALDIVVLGSPPTEAAEGSHGSCCNTNALEELVNTANDMVVKEKQKSALLSASGQDKGASSRRQALANAGNDMVVREKQNSALPSASSQDKGAISRRQAVSNAGNNMVVREKQASVLQSASSSSAQFEPGLPPSSPVYPVSTQYRLIYLPAPSADLSFAKLAGPLLEKLGLVDGLEDGKDSSGDDHDVDIWRAADLVEKGITLQEAEREATHAGRSPLGGGRQAVNTGRPIDPPPSSGRLAGNTGSSMAPPVASGRQAGTTSSTMGPPPASGRQAGATGSTMGPPPGSGPRAGTTGSFFGSSTGSGSNTGGGGRRSALGGNCRFESLDSLQHLSSDGFLHSWLPSYANISRVVTVSEAGGLSVTAPNAANGTKYCFISILKGKQPPRWAKVLNISAGRVLPELLQPLPLPLPSSTPDTSPTTPSQPVTQPLPLPSSTPDTTPTTPPQPLPLPLPSSTPDTTPATPPQPVIHPLPNPSPSPTAPPPLTASSNSPSQSTSAPGDAGCNPSPSPSQSSCAPGVAGCNPSPSPSSPSSASSSHFNSPDPFFTASPGHKAPSVLSPSHQVVPVHGATDAPVQGMAGATVSTTPVHRVAAVQIPRNMGGDIPEEDMDTPPDLSGCHAHGACPGAGGNAGAGAGAGAGGSAGAAAAAGVSAAAAAAAAGVSAGAGAGVSAAAAAAAAAGVSAGVSAAAGGSAGGSAGAGAGVNAGGSFPARGAPAGQASRSNYQLRPDTRKGSLTFLISPEDPTDIRLMWKPDSATAAQYSSIFGHDDDRKMSGDDELKEDGAELVIKLSPTRTRIRMVAGSNNQVLQVECPSSFTYHQPTEAPEAARSSEPASSSRNASGSTLPGTASCSTATCTASRGGTAACGGVTGPSGRISFFFWLQQSYSDDGFTGAFGLAEKLQSLLELPPQYDSAVHTPVGNRGRSSGQNQVQLGPLPLHLVAEIMKASGREIREDGSVSPLPPSTSAPSLSRRDASIGGRGRGRGGRGRQQHNLAASRIEALASDLVGEVLRSRLLGEVPPQAPLLQRERSATSGWGEGSRWEQGDGNRRGKKSLTSPKGRDREGKEDCTGTTANPPGAGPAGLGPPCSEGSNAANDESLIFDLD